MGSSGPVDRRTFVRRVLRQAAATATTVLDVRRELAVAGTDVLLGNGGPPVQAHALEDGAKACRPAERAYRVEADGLIAIVDQGREPDDHAEVSVRTAAELCRAIRDHVIDRGFALAPLVLHALAGTAATMSGFDPASRLHALTATVAILRRVAPCSGAVAAATHRARETWESDGEPGADVAGSLRSLAGEMEREVEFASETIGNSVAAHLMASERTTVDVLVHGDIGPLSGSEPGILLGALRILQVRSVSLHVYVPEGRPDLVGRRITAAELRTHGIPATVIPDSAVAHLVASASLSAVLLPIEAVTTDGFALAPLGAWPSVASAAEQRLPVFAVTPSFVLENPIRWSVPHDGSYELARDRPIVMDRVRLDMLQLITERSSAVGASWLR